MTRLGFINALARGGFFGGRWELDDDAYDAMSVAFVREIAWPAWVMSLPLTLRERRDSAPNVPKWFPKWLPEVFDCNHQALDFGVFLSRCMADDSVKLGKPRGAAASGRFDFTIQESPLLGHCRVVFIDYDGVAHDYDPGSDLLDVTTQQQKSTITFGESV